MVSEETNERVLRQRLFWVVGVSTTRDRDDSEGVKGRTQQMLKQGKVKSSLMCYWCNYIKYRLFSFNKRDELENSYLYGDIRLQHPAFRLHKSWNESNRSRFDGLACCDRQLALINQLETKEQLEVRVTSCVCFNLFVYIANVTLKQ